LTVANVDALLVTHAHPDHAGLVERVVAVSGARVFANAAAADILADPSGLIERQRALFADEMPAMGLPADRVDAVVSHIAIETDDLPPVAVDVELSDGDRLNLGYNLKAVFTPGHSPGSTTYHAREACVAFTGDTVLGHISPNPVLTVEPGSPADRTRSLPDYLDALETVQETGATLGYPGHGETIPDLSARIDEIQAHHRDRKEQIAALLETLEPAMPYDIMEEMWPGLPESQQLLGISEVVGHLDLLEVEGRVLVADDGKRYRYRLQ
jgi:glyoxylase-like metal-dependent hydrolase (beta-lactamase superfamily II)